MLVMTYSRKVCAAYGGIWSVSESESPLVRWWWIAYRCDREQHCATKALGKFVRGLVGTAFLSLAIREPSPIVERVEIVVRELGLVLLGVRQLHTRHGCHQALKELVGHALASFTGLLAVAEQNKVLDDLLQAATCIGCQ